MSIVFLFPPVVCGCSQSLILYLLGPKPLCLCMSNYLFTPAWIRGHKVTVVANVSLNVSSFDCSVFRCIFFSLTMLVPFLKNCSH